jgi:general secretion pathway protein K
MSAGIRNRQRGVAVLMAVLVVAVGTVIAVNIMWEATLNIRRTESALAADQGLLYLQGAEAWAADILAQDLADSQEYDHLGEDWATALEPLPIEGGAIVGRLEDLQGRFNLNNLLNPAGEEDELARAQFERLLSMLDLDPQLASIVIDWIDPDTSMHFPTGAEDGTYTGITPPYFAANTSITTPSELMALQGFDRQTYAALAPYVAALPRGTDVNVNTASNLVLASLSDDISLSLADSLIEERGGREFADIDTTFEGLVEADMLRRIDGVTQYFLLTVTVTLGTNQLTMRSVLRRDESGSTRAAFRSLGVE